MSAGENAAQRYEPKGTAFLPEGVVIAGMASSDIQRSSAVWLTPTRRAVMPRESAGPS